MLKKVLLALAALVVVAAIGACAAFNLSFPKVGPAPTRTVDKTPERVERGRYLANHVTVCIDCHSARDWTRFSGPIVPGSEGKGGDKFDRNMGFPGEFYAANITPKGIARYEDGELDRVITTGVTKEGRAIFPVMPYPRYAGLCQDDVDSLVAYVRTLAPLENAPPTTVLDFPMSVIVKTIPQEKPRPPCPDRNDRLALGSYLANAASCAECHTQFEKGSFLPGMEYAGGRPFEMPGGVVQTANLTPDVETGIGGWTKESFVARIRAHGIAGVPGQETPLVAPGQMQSIMPWTMYAGMRDEDLGAIFEFLRTVPAKKNAVTKWTAAAAPKSM